MPLVAMAIYDTPENGRDALTGRCLESLFWTVDLDRHRVVLVVNAATGQTEAHLDDYADLCEIIRMPRNVGTALAINQAWKLRPKGVHCIKVDNDVVFHRSGWADAMEEAFERDPKIGVLGLKRDDLIQNPNHPDEFYRSKLRFVPERPDGRPWMIVEETADIMGTCVAHNSALLDKIGFMFQPGLYGFDDVIMCLRSIKAGFSNCFLHGYPISHIDPGGDEYARWKGEQAMRFSAAYHEIKTKINDGTFPLWVDADYMPIV